MGKNKVGRPKTIGVSKKVFSVRLPNEVADKLLAMDTKQRTELIRNLIIEGIPE